MNTSNIACIKPLPVYRTVDIILVHLNSHTYIMLEVIFTLVGGLLFGSDFLFVCTLQPLVVAGYCYYQQLITLTTVTAYLITSDDNTPR